MRLILAGCHAENGDTLFPLADKEHPAAKAGRYVRAAGIVIGKEMDRRAAEAAAKPAPAAPPPPLPPPPPAETTTFAGRWLFRLFVASLVVLGLSVLHFADLVPGATAEKVVRLVLAGLLALEAFVLITNWRQGNERVGQRLLNRMWGPRGPANKREKVVARVVRDVLTLIGILFVAAAVYQLLVATIGT
jgi:hypothetical protein